MRGIVNVNTDYINDVLNRAKVSHKQASGELGRSEWYLNNLCKKPPEARAKTFPSRESVRDWRAREAACLWSKFGS
jgi:hypothetical protein